MTLATTGVKARTVQTILGEWHTRLLQRDLWPRATHQTLIDAAATALPEASRPEKGEFRILAVEALHHAVAGKRGRSKSIVGRIKCIEDWIGQKPGPDAIASKFGEATKYAAAF